MSAAVNLGHRGSLCVSGHCASASADQGRHEGLSEIRGGAARPQRLGRVRALGRGTYYFLVTSTKLAPATVLTKVLVEINARRFEHRDALIEPFDWGDHMFNATASFLPGFAVALGIAFIYYLRDLPANTRDARMNQAAGAALGALVLNIYAETDLVVPYAASHGFREPTSDPIDLVYGVAAATMAGALNPRLPTSDELTEAAGRRSCRLPRLMAKIRQSTGG